MQRSIHNISILNKEAFQFLGRIESSLPLIIETVTHLSAANGWQVFNAISAPKHTAFGETISETLAATLGHSAANHPTVGTHSQVIHAMLIVGEIVV